MRAPPCHRPAAIAGLALSLAVSSKGARADETPSLLLEPAPAGDRGAFVEGAAVRGHLLPSARVLVDYAHDPLAVRDARQRIDHAVERKAALHVLGAFSLWHRVAFHLDVPLVFAGAGDVLTPAGDVVPAPRQDAAAGLGDVRLGARARLLGTDEDARVQMAVALAASLWLPTAG